MDGSGLLLRKIGLEPYFASRISLL